MGHPLGLCRNRGATLRVALSCPRTCVLGEGCGLPVRARLGHACRPEPRLPARRPGRAETRQHCRNRGSPHPGSGSSMAERACCPPHGGSRPQSDSCCNSQPLWVKNEPRPLSTPQPPRVAMATLLERGGVASRGRGVSRGRERSGHWQVVGGEEKGTFEKVGSPEGLDGRAAGACGHHGARAAVDAACGWKVAAAAAWSPDMGRTRDSGKEAPRQDREGTGEQGGAPAPGSPRGEGAAGGGPEAPPRTPRSPRQGQRRAGVGGALTRRPREDRRRGRGSRGVFGARRRREPWGTAGMQPAGTSTRVTN